MRLSDIAEYRCDGTGLGISEFGIAVKGDTRWAVRVEDSCREKKSCRHCGRIPATPVIIGAGGSGDIIRCVKAKHFPSLQALRHRQRDSSGDNIRSPAHNPGGADTYIPVGKSQYTAGAQSSLSKSSRHRERGRPFRPLPCTTAAP